MVTIHSRASWGARYADGDKNLSGLAGEVFLHHTVTAQLPATASVEQERAQMRAIEDVGKERGFPGISYNVIVFPSGRAYQGVSFNRRGTHTGGRNSTSRSICLAGNYDVHQPTAAQIATAAAIYAHGKGRWWTTSAPLRGHREVKTTACPGKHAYARLGEIRSGGGTATLASAPAKAPATGRIAEDGVWGGETTRRLQQVLGTPADGIVSRQNRTIKPRNPGLGGGFEWVAPGSVGKGSTVIRAVQSRVGTDQDGVLGPITIKAIQRRMGTLVDGVVSKPSRMVKAMQARLNEGRF